MSSSPPRLQAGVTLADVPPVSICVLTYGNYPELVKRSIESIQQHCDRSLYRLIVGANAPGRATLKYLNETFAQGTIDHLIISRTNINKCPMMRQLFTLVDTEFVWWFDDDSYITEANTLERWLQIATTSAAAVVHWGHQFFFGHERDFSYGADVIGFVKQARWFRGKNPPSWESGGKDEHDFEGRGCGDGRWFFLTGGCWMIRADVIKSLDWPDHRLIKRNDDVFLCEAIRQQGLEIRDIGPLGVMINTGPRRGAGEDAATMSRQIEGEATPAESQFTPEKPVFIATHTRSNFSPQSEGCVFLPTFNDTASLELNFADRAELASAIDFHVFDDNFDEAESEQIQYLCERNGWWYHQCKRGRHGGIVEDEGDLENWNRLCFENLIELSKSYEYVVKVDTDALLIDPCWFKEFGRLLVGRSAYAGTPEFRPIGDVNAFTYIAKEYGYAFDPGPKALHVQGGISGYSRKALHALEKMGFLEGRHPYAEDCYLSYALQALGIPFLKTKTIGSWWHPYRPSLSELVHLKAIHPLSKTEWELFRSQPEKAFT